MPTDFSGGRAPTRRQSHRAAILNEPARPMFDLKHHPARWQEVDGELLPNLARLSHQRGVNNVDHHGDTTLAEVHASRQGWTILPPSSCPASMTPDGIEGYVRVFDGKSGPIHVTPWERPRSLGSRVVWDRDEEGYRVWLRHLVAEGFVPPPDAAVVDIIREGLIAKRERKAGAADVNPYARHAVGKIDEDLARLDAAWALANGEQPAPAPAPKTKRGGK